MQGRLDPGDDNGYFWQPCTVQAIDENTVLVVHGEKTVTLSRKDGPATHTVELQDVHWIIERSFLGMNCCGRSPANHGMEQPIAGDVVLDENAVLPPLDPSTEEEASHPCLCYQSAVLHPDCVERL